MIKVIGTIMLILLFYACASVGNLKHNSLEGAYYLINSIDSINNWYMIYAARNDSLFKIVVQKESTTSYECKKIIKVEGRYKLTLHPRKKEILKIHGFIVNPINCLDVQCYTYDDKTEICIEPKKGIYDL
ncbi:hypothetical protein [Sphingobacterium siyangense]|uniref:hypothetical protein n=1 Tax=Sphingobacterium siyangense TaxID=459529 RepID=UPI002FD8A147